MTADLGSPRGFSLVERRRLSRLIADTDAEYVVLIGSWARGTQSEATSDIDILVGLPAGRRCPSAIRMHAICLSSRELEERTSAGDDLALWCLKFGIPLSGRSTWHRLKERLLKNGVQPRPQPKLDLATSQFSYAEELLEMGDVEASQEELKVGLGHLSRALLITRGVFPLSRPEIPHQLRSIGEEGLARLLDEVSTTSMEPKVVEQALGKARGQLGQIQASA